MSDVMADREFKLVVARILDAWRDPVEDGQPTLWQGWWW